VLGSGAFILVPKLPALIFLYLLIYKFLVLIKRNYLKNIEH